MTGFMRVQRMGQADVDRAIQQSLGIGVGNGGIIRPVLKPERWIVRIDQVFQAVQGTRQTNYRSKIILGSIP